MFGLKLNKYEYFQPLEVTAIHNQVVQNLNKLTWQDKGYNKYSPVNMRHWPNAG